MIAAVFAFALKFALRPLGKLLAAVFQHWRISLPIILIGLAIAWGNWQHHRASAAISAKAAVQTRLATLQAAEKQADAEAAARQKQLDAQALAQARKIAAQMNARARNARADLSAIRAAQQSLEQEITNANANASTVHRQCAAMVLPGGVQHAIADALRNANRHPEGPAIQDLQPGSEASAGLPARGAHGAGGG